MPTDPVVKKSTRRLGPDWAPKFVAALRAERSITHACKVAQIGRGSYLRRYKADPEFHVQVDEVWAETVDALEASALKRAIEGWQEPVYFQGVRVGWKRIFSPGLTIFMLKTWKPEKYNVPDYTSEQTAAERAQAVRDALKAMSEASSPKPSSAKGT